VAVIKHANPCGTAEAPTLVEAYRMALRADPVSAYGGVIALNRPLDSVTASEIIKIFTEVIIAPDATAEAREIIATRKNLRLLLAGAVPDPAQPGIEIRSIAGGFLAQARDNAVVTTRDWRVVTKRAPDEWESSDLLFAFRVVKHVKSNAIVFAKSGATVGIGAGQTSRVDAVHIAVRKAGEIARAKGPPGNPLKGSVVASDAFFPFADGLTAAAEAGATAVIQPGGSVRDQEVIAAADAAGMAMVFTGTRHFRH
jgi:phosphoribosylaminoimidazolecarboxamide formyltransferase/IMP cyclohydrolase